MMLPIQDVLVTLIAAACAIVPIRRLFGVVRREPPKCSACDGCGKGPSIEPEPLITIRTKRP